MQNIQVTIPLFEVVIRIKDRGDDVDNSKVIAFVHSNVSSIFVFGKHKASLTTRKEVNIGHIVTFKKDVVFFRVLTRL